MKEPELKWEGDPTVRMQSLLTHDMARQEIRERTSKLIDLYQSTYNSNPGWVRVASDLVRIRGTPVYREYCTVCGLVFREAPDLTNKIEVGNSLFE